MAKRSGLGNRFYMQGVDASGDICALKSIASPQALLDFTSIDKSAMERKGGLRDGTMEFKAYFNPSAGTAFHVFKAMPTTDVLTSYALSATLGDDCANMIAKETSNEVSREDDGGFYFEVGAVANGYGLEWGNQLTAGVRTESTATNGTGVDFGTGSTTFGLQAYLHVTALGSGTPTIKLQESSNDGGGDAYADVTGGTFGVVTAGQATRIATSNVQTVERYLRVVTTGTFSGLSFWVGVTRNDTATAF